MRFRRVSWGRALTVVSAVALVAVVAAAVAGTSSATRSKPSVEPFNVLAVLPMSGPLALIGKIEADGAKAAAAVINARGGILEHQVKLKVVDDAADGSKAVTALQAELAKGTKYDLLLLGAFDQDAAPLIAAGKNNPTLQISMSSVVLDPKKTPAAFNTGTGFPPNAEALVLKMKKDGITKFAIVCGNDASGQGGAKALQSSAKAHGLTVTKTVFVPDDAPDATPQVQQAVSSGPQAIAVAAYTPADGPILKARTKLNVTLPVYGDAFFADVNFSAVVTPADLKGVVLENFPWLVKGDPATTTAGWRAFHAAFGKLEPHPPVTLAAPIVSYDAVLLARAAALRAKSVDGAALAKAMPHVSLASQVPGWIGGKKIYLPASHVLLVEASDLKFYKAGGQVDGLLVPGK